MSSPVSIELDDGMFSTRERPLAQAGATKVRSFRYPSGVAALHVENGAGNVILLPFQGQQVWDAEFLGRRLTMHSMFREPVATRDYLRTYGAFFIHCGGTSMGNPSGEDRHPLHGELPNMPYAHATLTLGRDDAGGYIELSGAARDTQAFHHDFVMRPALRLYEGGTSFRARVAVENRSAKPMPFLYLAHINFRPVDGGSLVDAVRDDRTDIVIRAPQLDADTRAGVRAYHDAINADPSAHRQLLPGVPVEPELVLTMKAAASPQGWTHAMHRHPDGTSDFVSYRPADLPYAVRWMVRDGDQDALGLVLPATAAPDGFAAAKRKGQIVWIEPGGSFRTQMWFGALDQAATEGLSGAIASIRAG